MIRSSRRAFTLVDPDRRAGHRAHRPARQADLARAGDHRDPRRHAAARQAGALGHRFSRRCDHGHRHRRGCLYATPRHPAHHRGDFLLHHRNAPHAQSLGVGNRTNGSWAENGGRNGLNGTSGRRKWHYRVKDIIRTFILGYGDKLL